MSPCLSLAMPIYKTKLQFQSFFFYSFHLFNIYILNTNYFQKLIVFIHFHGSQWMSVQSAI